MFPLIIKLLKFVVPPATIMFDCVETWEVIETVSKIEQELFKLKFSLSSVIVEYFMIKDETLSTLINPNKTSKFAVSTRQLLVLVHKNGVELPFIHLKFLVIKLELSSIVKKLVPWPEPLALATTLLRFNDVVLRVTLGQLSKYI